MNLNAVRKMDIVNLLYSIPDDKLEQVEKYVKLIVSESEITAKKNKSLKGIWKNKGFDKIKDLDSQVIKARKQLGNSILSRKI